MLSNILYDNLIGIVLIYGFYKYAKQSIITASSVVKNKVLWLRHISSDDLQGAVELILISLAHTLLAMSLIVFFKIDTNTLFFANLSPRLIFLGILLGIAQMGLSMLVNRALIQTFTHLKHKNLPRDIQDWISASRSGWIRHHLSLLKVLPFYVAIVFTLLQISSEEIIFRGVLFNLYQSHFGFMVSTLLSTLFFSYMQSFLMPSKVSAMFPVVGALIMGVSNCYLMSLIPNIVPLVIGHITFFIIAVL